MHPRQEKCRVTFRLLSLYEVLGTFSFSAPKCKSTKEKKAIKKITSLIPFSALRHAFRPRSGRRRTRKHHLEKETKHTCVHPKDRRSAECPTFQRRICLSKLLWEGWAWGRRPWWPFGDRPCHRVHSGGGMVTCADQAGDATLLTADLLTHPQGKAWDAADTHGIRGQHIGVPTNSPTVLGDEWVADSALFRLLWQARRDRT